MDTTLRNVGASKTLPGVHLAKNSSVFGLDHPERS